MNVIRDWFARYLSDPQVVTLALSLVVGILVLIFFGHLLTPILAAAVVAYLLEGPVRFLQRLHVPRPVSAGVLSLALLVGVGASLLALVPLLARQAGQVFQDVPSLIASAQAWLLSLPQRYPSLITSDQVQNMLTAATQDIGSLRQYVFSHFVVVGVGILYIAVYTVLVPLLVFFFLRDKDVIFNWLSRVVPRNQGLVRSVWSEVDHQMGNYIRGKVLEIVLVWGVTWAVFYLLGLKYALLLSLLTGVSVLVPYLGALSVTIPVAMVAYSQWGWSPQSAYVLLAYAGIHAVDGNIVVPLLFSEAVNLHPVAIIVAVVFFGGVWGFWGVFFAIPLATVVNAVINAWPRPQQLSRQSE